ncbi:MAG: hypothetical protein EOP85_19935 [Verrucomicrobiaceae bacterium]|nr:MAG: hypothetical protein EOP85_19935 [Verrucomicrobiaceae bacterium]
MSFEEWQQCVHPTRMLGYLRGSNPQSGRTDAYINPGWFDGRIYPGPSPHATSEQCREFGRHVSLLWSVLGNRSGEEYKDGWGRKAADLRDIYETTVFLDYAASEAYNLAAGSLALTSAADAGLTEEEKQFEGWGEPDDPLYQEVSKALRVLHACMIREVFTWPCIPMPDTE